MSEYIIPNNQLPKPQLSLLRTATILGLQNVQIVNAKNNPYEGKPELQLKYTKDEALGTSILGTPVYTDLCLKGLKYTDNITNREIDLPNDRYRSGATGSNKNSAYYMILDSILMTVSQAQRIIKTEIQGRNGTVKEYIGADDAQITIQGIITGQNGVHPKDEVKRLKDWLDAPVSKSVTAWWLNNLGINQLVVDSYSLPQTEGGYSYQVFSINCISDLPIELRITQQL